MSPSSFAELLAPRRERGAAYAVPRPEAAAGSEPPLAEAPVARETPLRRETPLERETPLGREALFRLSDSAAALIALALVWYSGPGSGPAGVHGADAVVFGAVLWLWPSLRTLAASGARPAAPRWIDEVRLTATATALGALPILGYGAAVRGTSGVAVAVLFWAGATAGGLALRSALGWAVEGAAEELPRQVLIVGSGPRAAHLLAELRESAPGTVPVGIVDSVDYGLAHQSGLPLLGDPESIEQILMWRVVDEVLIALPIASCYSTIQKVITACERSGIPSRFVADMFHCSVATARYEQNGTAPVISMKVFADDYRLVVKRVIDIAVALPATLLLAPVLALTALAVKLTSRGPIFFAQERYGLNKRRFRIYKFRTMVEGAEEWQAELELRNEASGPVFKIRRDPRMTPIGAFLRRTSLDELPQLWNVLRGDMSLVGPRPLPVRDVSRFDQPWLMRRFSVRPGITCLWQVGGRNELSFDDWVALDLQYIDRWSLILDWKILARTLPAVVRGRGAM